MPLKALCAYHPPATGNPAAFHQDSSALCPLPLFIMQDLYELVRDCDKVLTL